MSRTCREVGGVNLGLVAGPRENPRMKGCSSVILDPHNEGNLRDEGALTGPGTRVPPWHRAYQGRELPLTHVLKGRGSVGHISRIAFVEIAFR